MNKNNQNAIETGFNNNINEYEISHHSIISEEWKEVYNDLLKKQKKLYQKRKKKI